MQQTATKTLIQVAVSCSTDDGCDPISAEELNCLLVGLQNAQPSVRDSSMKVSFNVFFARARKLKREGGYDWFAYILAFVGFGSVNFGFSDYEEGSPIMPEGNETRMDCQIRCVRGE